jgi:hypothetical protein
MKLLYSTMKIQVIRIRSRLICQVDHNVWCSHEDENVETVE